ncbi:hypothetical protein [Streptomyces millisiae]|uniref:Uncharacterized protein n=1 Tax=Streptomyces millisiae TaxID=3075542 RepID=A0ABU2LLU5_9ACTN|nr:hypothetical protein [Streptomyces sp. DSM 44918]MDT0318570.1 hypothetical protein [Streptomyces sp. DSM 44918]
MPATTAAVAAPADEHDEPSCDPVEDWDCIPQPDPNPPGGDTLEPDDGADEEMEDLDDGGPGGFAGWVFDGITSAINAFFTGLATAALNPLLELLGNTLLTTPTPDQLPHVDALWSRSWQIVLASYSVLVMAAGIIVMGYQTVQTQYSAREIAPRLILGFLASALSLFFATRMIVIANALTGAFLDPGIAPEAPRVALTDLILSSMDSSNMFMVFLALAVAGFLVAVLVTYVVRVALTTILLAAAPLALMCHALPQTDAIARWWWRAFSGLLAIQVAQSLTLVTALNVFLSSDGFTFLGTTPGTGTINMIVSLGLMYILFKIPFWIMAATRLTSGRPSLAGRLVRAYLTYKTFGLLRGGVTATRAAHSAGSMAPTRRPPSGGPPTMPARRPGPRRPPGQPLFLAPNQRPAPRPFHTPTAPGLPTFQAPGGPAHPGFLRASAPSGQPTFHGPHSGAPRPHPNRTSAPPGPPVFLAPQAGRSTPPPRGRPTAPVPGRPLFQQSGTPATSGPPSHAPQAPAAPTFRSPGSLGGGNVPLPPRGRAPAPTTFTSAPPTPRTSKKS